MNGTKGHLVHEEMDNELLENFLDETAELIDAMEEKLFDLEKQPGNSATLNAIFRSVHSVKGNASLFGFKVGRAIAHRIENFLAFLQSNPELVTREAISILFKGFHLLKGYFSDIVEKKEREELSPADYDLLEKLKEAEKSLKVPSGEETERYTLKVEEIVRERLGDTPELKQILEDIGHLNEMAREGGADAAALSEDGSATGDALQAEHADIVSELLKAAACGENGKNEKVRIEKALSALEKQRNQKGGMKEALDAFAVFRMEYRELSADETELDELAASDLYEKWKGISNRYLQENPEKSEPEPEPEVTQEETICTPDREGTGEEADGINQGTKGKLPCRKFMRVDEEKIDDFMGYAGELIVTAGMFNYLQRRVGKIASGDKEIQGALKNLSVSLNELSGNLQKSLLAVRRIPLRPLFTKLERTAREAARELQKDVAFHVEGSEEEIDKRLIELLDAPLLHLVKNSVDHGIEAPEIREKSGKSRAGNLYLKVEPDGDRMTVTLTDDGKGLDPELIKEKLIGKGLINERQAENMSCDDLFSHLFIPGFSTVDSVTDISGRGVGMDVVKTNIEKADGTVSLESEAGKGTNVKLAFPLGITLTVQTVLTAGVGGEELLISVENIIEALQPEQGSVYTGEKKGEMVKLRDEIYPLFRVSDLLSLAGAETRPEKSTCLVVSAHGRKSVVMVDWIRECRQVVVQDPGRFASQMRWFEGAAIRENGDVGLVLDIDKVIETAGGP